MSDGDVFGPVVAARDAAGGWPAATVILQSQQDAGGGDRLALCFTVAGTPGTRFRAGRNAAGTISATNGAASRRALTLAPDLTCLGPAARLRHYKSVTDFAPVQATCRRWRRGPACPDGDRRASRPSPAPKSAQDGVRSRVSFLLRELAGRNRIRPECADETDCRSRPAHPLVPALLSPACGLLPADRPATLIAPAHFGVPSPDRAVVSYVAAR